MTEWERTQESCEHFFRAMEAKLLGVGYTARCIHCGKVSFIDLSQGVKNAEHDGYRFYGMEFIEFEKGKAYLNLEQLTTGVKE